jgi:hypothetical protein
MSVQCWNDANFGGQTYVWTSNDPNVGAGMADQISSFKLAPWSQAIFFADAGYKSDNTTFTNNHVTTMSVPDLKTIAYGTNA